MSAGAAAESAPTQELARRARALLERGDFAAAADLLRAGLDGAGRDPAAAEPLYVLAVAERHLKHYDAALETLEALHEADPAHARAWQERGHTCLTLNRFDAARRAYEKAVDLDPALFAPWKALANLYRLAGRAGAARHAGEQAARLEALPPALQTVESMLHQKRLLDAERLCRHFLRKHPHDVEALRLLARIAEALEVSTDAGFLFESCVELAPDHDGVREDYANHLLRMQKFGKACEQARILVERQPANPVHRSILASAMAGIGKHAEAIAMYDRILAESPEQGALYVMRGHAQKTLGAIDEAIASYRRACEVRPDHGDAFWSLANTKTYRFTDAEIARMKQAAAASETRLDDRIHLCFALGKALEDREEFADSFAFYSRGNDLKRAGSRHNAAHLDLRVEAQMSVCTADFFAARAAAGCPAPDPVFIVGLPRAGSTLLEQILASHSRVDGTTELPNVIALAQRLRNSPSLLDEDGKPRYPAVLETLDPDYFRRFGEQFIADTRVQRGQAPFFIDKNPNNFFHVGLIRLILPNAKVIDARRHPMACCFSGFKQLFGQGQQFSYGLESIGHYYRRYVELMDHWDEVLPGFVLRVQHEDVVDDLEGQVRRMLDFCGLPFERDCVDFHRTERAVRTPSSEQVRQPIYRGGLDQWRNFAAWLDPLRQALGPEVRRRYDIADPATGPAAAPSPP